MADSIQVFPPGYRLQKADGTILAGGSIEFFDAGTTDAKSVYSDSSLSTALGSIVYLDAGGAPVAEEGSSTKVAVYVGTDAYKVVIKDSSGVVIETKDEIQGAFDSASILETLVLIPETEVETLTGAETLTSDDAGQLKNCNTTGGGFAVTLPDATDVNGGSRFGIRMAGAANAVTIRTTAGQTITRAGITSTTFSLSRFGESVWLVNDGGNWVEDTYVPPLHNTVGVIAVADRLATPPITPDAGARYILTSGPDDAWSSYAEHDVVEADGNGGWFRYTPATDCGWLAYVQDEDEYYAFIGSAWVQLITRPADRTAMEAGASELKAVTPGVQHFHPSAAKFWAYVTVAGGTPTLADSYNVTGITDSGQGDLTVTIDNDFASENWCPAVSVRFSPTNLDTLTVISQTAGTVRVLYRQGQDEGSGVDPLAWAIIGFGELA